GGVEVGEEVVREVGDGARDEVEEEEVGVGAGGAGEGDAAPVGAPGDGEHGVDVRQAVVLRAPRLDVDDGDGLARPALDGDGEAAAVGAPGEPGREDAEALEGRVVLAVDELDGGLGAAGRDDVDVE